MKSTKKILFTLTALALPFIALAQTAVSTTYNDPATYGLRRAGEREFTIGGSGAANTDFDHSFGGVNMSYGWYTSETQAWVIRQTVNYSNFDTTEDAWNGSTRLAFDQHIFGRGALRPFIGANIGGVYGDGISETFAAGLEGGVKFYVQNRTFVYLLAEYGWFFNEADRLEDDFNDGQFNWSVGLGFNF